MTKLKVGDYVRAVGPLKKTEDLCGVEDEMKSIVKGNAVMQVRSRFRTLIINAGVPGDIDFSWHKADLQKVRKPKGF